VSALLPEVYGDTINHEVAVGGVSRVGTTASAVPPRQIEDADFTMISEAPRACSGNGGSHGRGARLMAPQMTEETRRSPFRKGQLNL
jgi:hypothetical protein